MVCKTEPMETVFPKRKTSPPAARNISFQNTDEKVSFLYFFLFSARKILSAMILPTAAIAVLLRFSSILASFGQRTNFCTSSKACCFSCISLGKKSISDHIDGR